MEIKQVVITGQSEAELQTDRLNTENLDPNQVLIETEYTYISTGTELANYSGKEPKVFQPGQWCTYPWKSGYANVGRVRAVGRNANRVSVDDRVFTYGNHTSAHRYDSQRLVVPVPDSIDPAIAAASRMAGVAITAPIVSQIQNDPWVVIFGLGMPNI